MRRTLALAVVLFAARTATGAGAAEASAEPVFADLSGNAVRLSDRGGEVVLLNFWSTWCAPCRKEMPVFVRLHDELGPRGLRVLGVAANGRDEVAAVTRVMGQLDMRFEVWTWANAFDMEHYGVGPGLPATLVVDRDGRIVRRFRGLVTEAQLRPVVEELLAMGVAAPVSPSSGP